MLSALIAYVNSVGPRVAGNRVLSALIAYVNSVGPTVAGNCERSSVVNNVPTQKIACGGGTRQPGLIQRLYGSGSVLERRTAR